ncbi:MAG: HDIG domain-containing protein, partial [Clostridia bacterium]|nr:HDIG domain-containing protein [Clostridia bacterium]
MNFTPVDNNGRVEGFCIVKSAEQKTSSKGDSYLDMMLGDCDGEINGKLWRYQPEVHGEYGVNDIVKVRGTVSKYNGADQLRIERIRPSQPEDNVSIEDFVRTSGYSSEDMYEYLVKTAEAFNDRELSRIVTEIYADNRLSLLYWPAAFKLHHAVRGGLLMHTLSIVKLAEGVCNIYPFVDRELLISGAMLHDIAKISEFEVGDSGIAEGYSVEGNLIGHLTMGAMAIEKYAQKLEISKKTAMLLEHMVISHHGEP